MRGIVSIIALLALATGPALANTITYQGQLEQSGTPFTGTARIIFALAKDEQSVPFQTLDPKDVEIVGGLFQVELEFSEDAFADMPRWLEISVDGTTLGDRQKITAVPFALSAGLTVGDSPWSVVDSNINYQGGNVGIGLANPARRLQVSGSVIFGRPGNTASIGDAFVSGGLALETNSAGGQSSFVGGGFGNATSATAAFVGGGRDNTASGTHSFVAGGRDNRAEGANSIVLGGSGNTASGDFSFVSGGDVVPGTFPQVLRGNIASGSSSFVGGGILNEASGGLSFVGGGIRNFAAGTASFIGGGSDNSAGSLGFVGGGAGNCAGGSGSWASGFRAKVRPGPDSAISNSSGCKDVPVSPSDIGDSYTFVWADGTLGDFVSTGNNQFLVRAGGGVYFGTNSTVNLPSDRFINTSTGAGLTRGGTWVNASSRDLKADFLPVDSLEILDLVVGLPIKRWRYRNAEAFQHLGPVAEDFHASFRLGTDAESISTVDAAGVALAAIQGLNLRLNQENAELRAEVAVLKVQSGQVRELERRLAVMEARERENDDLRARLAALEAVLLDHGQIARTER